MHMRKASLLAMAALLVIAGGARSLAQAPTPPAPPAPPPELISVAEAHAIIDGAVVYAREKNWRMGVVVLDTSGDIVAGERMDGASGRNVKFAEAKAYAAVMYRTTTQALSEIYKTRPDRYFGTAPPAQARCRSLPSAAARRLSLSGADADRMMRFG